ncbi:helix-turn-helix domain-containing protein [Streptococcus hongkongensis]|nr:XRE family transcriptional regulator [Streptococcus uberis]
MIGDNIYKERIKIGMTQENLSDYLNLTKSTISKWENNQAKPDIDYLIQLAKLFDMTLDELVDFHSLLTADERKELINILHKDKELLNQEDFFQKIDHLSRQYINDSKVILMLVQVVLNTPNSLNTKDWSLNLLNRIISKTNVESDLQAAMTLKTVILFQNQAYDDIITLYQDRPYKMGEELFLANSYAAKGNLPMARQVLQVESYQQVLLLCEYLSSLLAYDDGQQQESISQRLEKLMTIFDIENLHPNTAIRSHYALAVHNCISYPDKAIENINHLVISLENLLNQFELHGDDFFYAISEWLTNLPMGIQPLTSKLAVIEQIEASLQVTPLNTLAKENSYKEALQKIQELKEAYRK